MAEQEAARNRTGGRATGASAPPVGTGAVSTCSATAPAPTAYRDADEQGNVPLLPGGRTMGFPPGLIGGQGDSRGR